MFKQGEVQMTKANIVEKFIAEFNTRCEKKGLRKFAIHHDSKGMAFLKFNTKNVVDRLALGQLVVLPNLKKWNDIYMWREKTGEVYLYTK